MIQRTRLGLILALAGLLAGCIDDAREEADMAAPDVADGAQETTHPDVVANACRIDLDCPAVSDACGRARCDDGACRIAQVSCDDGNDCTDDACDPAFGCVASASPLAQACLAGAGSKSCVGDVYHLADLCDGAGQCRDNGSQDCGAEVGGACFRFACLVTDNGGGCEVAPRPDGLACSADGLSSEAPGEFVCIEGALHGADACVAGECAEGGSAGCPSGFCEAARCDGQGGCAVGDVGVERVMSGNWLLLEMFAAQSAGGPRLGTGQTGFAFNGDGTVTTYGTFTSVPQATTPGDGDYCISSEGDLQFALPYGAVAPAPRKVYRGALAGGDDMALVFRQGEPSLGVLLRLPVGNAPKLVGRYRMVGAFRRNVIGTRAVLGEITFDAQGCTTGGEVAFSDELEKVAIAPGDCQGIVAWLVGLRIAFDSEAYTFRGTSNHDGDTAALTIHTDMTSVGDGIMLLMRDSEILGSFYPGRHTFARIDIHDEVVTAARGEAVVGDDGRYSGYQEISLDGVRLVGEGSVFEAGASPAGHREESAQRIGANRVRYGAGSGVTLGRVGVLADVLVPADAFENRAFPMGTSLRIAIVRPKDKR